MTLGIAGTVSNGQCTQGDVLDIGFGQYSHPKSGVHFYNGIYGRAECLHVRNRFLRIANGGMAKPGNVDCALKD